MKKGIFKCLYVVLISVVIGLFMVFNSLLSSVNLDNVKASSYDGEEFYVKADSLLKTSPKKIPSSIITVIKGTKVTHIPSSKDTKSYYYVTIHSSKKENEKFYIKDYSGYILKKRLTKNVTSHSSNRNLRVSDKTYVTRNALLLYKVNKYYLSRYNKNIFQYSSKDALRDKGYNLVLNEKNINSNKQYYFDCSSLVSTIYKVTFDIDFLTTKNKLYRTYDFYNIVKSGKEKTTKGMFYIVDKVTINSDRKKLYTSRLQAGDLILGINKTSISDTSSTSYNHIMLYVGDQTAIDSSGRNNEKIRYINLTKKYTTVSKSNDYRFSKEIYVLRLSKNARKNKDVMKLSINNNYDKFSINKAR